MFLFYNVNQISRNFYLNFNFAKNIHAKEINVNYVFFLLLLSCKKKFTHGTTQRFSDNKIHNCHFKLSWTITINFIIGKPLRCPNYPIVSIAPFSLIFCCFNIYVFIFVYLVFLFVLLIFIIYYFIFLLFLFLFLFFCKKLFLQLIDNC